MTFDIDRARQLGATAGATPLPAWALSAALLYQGVTSHRPVDAKLGSGGSSRFSKALASQRPTRLLCFLFGGALALGGYIVYDGDVENGAGFSGAWATLYLLVNGRAAVKNFFWGRVKPVGYALLALGNAGVYGKQYIWGY